MHNGIAWQEVSATVGASTDNKRFFARILIAAYQELHLRPVIPVIFHNPVNWDREAFSENPILQGVSQTSRNTAPFTAR